MAHYAKIDSDGNVSEVIVVNNAVLLNDDGIEDGARGSQFCHDTFGGTWVQTSYNGNFRGVFASIDSVYDAERDMFTPPRPYPSWTYDWNLNKWVAPVPEPVTTKRNLWHEDTQQWEEVEISDPRV